MSPALNNAKMQHASLDDALIDRIVREVVRRLAEAEPSDAAKAASSPAFAFQKKLLTVASLTELPAGVQRVETCATTVVTPAAVDELKLRGIELKRTSKQALLPTESHSLRQSTGNGNSLVSATSPATRLIIGRIDAASGPGWDAAQTHGQATIHGGLTSVVARLVKALSGNNRGLLVTSAPAVAMYHACRNGLRAVYGRSAVEIMEACEQIQANLLVIEAGRHPNGAIQSFLEST